MYRKVIKRVLDIIISLAALIILSPVLLVVAILVRCKLGSPVIFHQERPGYHEKIFKLCKFRSMTDERDAEGNLLPDAVRLTKFGKILRAASLDELPELWNILKGDMSFVGPRPERPEFIAKAVEDIPEFVLRTKVKAGLTGYAQVMGNYNTSFLDKLKWDLMYIENYSLFLDLKILLMTAIAIFAKDNHEDFSKWDML